MSDKNVDITVDVMDKVSRQEEDGIIILAQKELSIFFKRNFRKKAVDLAGIWSFYRRNYFFLQKELGLFTEGIDSRE